MDLRSGKNDSRIYSNGGIKKKRKDQCDGGESDEMGGENEKSGGRQSTASAGKREKEMKKRNY